MSWERLGMVDDPRSSDDARDAARTRVAFRDVDDADLVAEQAASAATEPALPRRIGGFRIVRRIGEGGMGAVYEAEQDRPQRRVALKVLRTGLASRMMQGRFEREIALLGRLCHPNVAQVFAAGTHVPTRDSLEPGPLPFFAMELVDGGLSIHRFVAEHELDRAARVELFLAVCAAIQHGHDCGVLHRDLKPDNVLVDREGRVKVIDFGVACALAADGSSSLRTEVGQIVGTVQYMSPEQSSGDSRLDARSDVYALGLLLHELLLDRLPYDVRGMSLAEAVVVVREATQVGPEVKDKSLDRDLARVLRKALEPQPARRYAAASHLAADLERWLAGEPVACRPTGVFPRILARARRHRATVAAWAACLVLTVASGVAIASLLDRIESESAAREVAERSAEERGILAREALSEAESLHGQLASLVAAAPVSAATHVALEAARRRLDDVAQRTADDERLSLVIADGYELLGDLLARAQPDDDPKRVEAYRRSLELTRRAIARGEPASGVALLDGDAMAAAERASIWRLPEREGKLLLKLGRAGEGTAALEVAYQLGERALARRPGDAAIALGLADLAARIEALHRASGDPQRADQYAARRRELVRRATSALTRPRRAPPSLDAPPPGGIPPTPHLDEVCEPSTS
jgi:hypothetical protein